MLVIRLKRIGRKNQPYFRLVVQERAQAPSSSAKEEIGTYNPHTDPAQIELKEERVKYWLGQGAQPSPTVHNMLVNAGLVKGGKKRAVQPKIKKKESDSASPEAPQESGKDEKKEGAPKEVTKKEERKEETKEKKKEEEE